MSIDYNKTDRLFGIIESTFGEVAGRERLGRVRIERWVREASIVVLSWSNEGPEPINRNVVFHVIHIFDQVQPTVIADIKINAWLDKDGKRKRQYAVVESKRVFYLDDLERNNQVLVRDLCRACQRVSRWTESDLTET